MTLQPITALAKHAVVVVVTVAAFAGCATQTPTTDPSLGADEQPKQAAPFQRYPEESLKNGETGTVIVEIQLGDDGKVEAARVKSSSGFQRLDDAALAFARQKQYPPIVREFATSDGKIDIPFQFSIEPEKKGPAR